MIYYRIKGSLKFLTGSDHRVRVLLSLADGPKNIRGLHEEIGLDKPKILHCMTPMISEGLIARERGVYSLTGAGRLNTALLENMLRGLSAIQENKQFWESHDLSGIPAALQADIGKLAGCTCVQDDHTVMTSLENFIDIVSKAKRIWGVYSVIARDHVELIDGQLQAGSEVNLILTKRIIAQIDPTTIARWAKAANLYEMPDGCCAAFTVSDDILSLGLYLPNSQYDTSQCLICPGPGAVEWGMRLFECYLEQARLVKTPPSFGSRL